jgi:chloramphenicol O-acetyltransferase type A
VTYKIQPLDEWKRKEQFLFYNEFTEPMYGISVDLDITSLYHYCRKNEQSIFVSYLHEIIKAVNCVEEFRYRYDGENVIVYDQIGISVTVARENETFAFSYIDYDANFPDFAESAASEIARVRETSDFTPFANKLDLIHFSAVPWIQFTSLSHARHHEFKDTIPKISTGKIYHSGERTLMPISVHAHHGLVDAIHIGKLYSLVENNIQEQYGA